MSDSDPPGPRRAAERSHSEGPERVGDTDGPARSGCFEDRLLHELTALVCERRDTAAAEPVPSAPAPRVRLRRTVVVAASVAVGATAVVLPTVLWGGHGHGSNAAYAVERHDNGKVSLQVQGVIASPQDMEHDLKQAGARVAVIPDGARCNPHARPVAAPRGMLDRTGPKTFVIDPDKIPQGTTLVAQVPSRHRVGPLRLSLTKGAPPKC